ncbi:MAG TPA: tetratricopeptide repeat protein, partial [Pyrinomonadaceae bacterium]
LVAASATFAQVRGTGRLQGPVTDAATSKPIEGATVTITMAQGSTQPIVTRTNARGKWSALGLTGGAWNVDIEAKGYATSRGSVNVSMGQLMPPINTALTAEAPQQEEAAVATSPGVPQEVIDAINNGQALMAAEKYKEAVVELEKALPALPDNMSLKQVTAQAYYKAGELKKAIELLEVVTKSPESNNGLVLLLTNLYLENGQLDEAKALLGTLPPDAITDPTVYMNIGILFLNKNNPGEAVNYLTSAVDMDMTRADTLYYRGLAYLQQKKNKEAKADFEKVLQLSPDSAEGRDAKQLIDSLK